MSRMSGFTAKTAEKMLLDAGAFFKNYDTSKTYAANVTAGNLLGATQGGGTFSAVPTIRKVEVDGVPGATKGLERIDEWAITMTLNLLEADANAVQLALGAASSSSATAPTGYTSVVGKSDIESADYMENVAWVGKLSGATNPVIILVKNALATGGLSLTMADKAEALVAVTVTGHYDADDLDTPPFEILYPGT